MEKTLSKQTTSHVVKIAFSLSPVLYTSFVRTKFGIKEYVENYFTSVFDFHKSSVLDFGCGTGDVSYLFDPRFYLGIDIDGDRINYARHHNPGYTFEIISQNHIPVPDNEFDFIVVVAVIHHISDEVMSEYIDEFYRVLKPAGYIIAIEPCLTDDRSCCNVLMNTFDVGEHIRTEDGYLSLFDEHFEVTVHKKFNKLPFYKEIFFSARKRI